MSKSKEVVGIIVGRFQTPSLHKGHRALFRHVIARHKTVLVVLGTTYTPSENDPYAYEIRVGMITSTFPKQRFKFICSEALPPKDQARSRVLDLRIKAAIGDSKAVLYGSSDSIVHTYQGAYPKRELKPVRSPRATEIRNSIGIVNSVDFRKGVAWAVRTRAAISYPTVDVAVVDGERVLLIEKADDPGEWRFPGVFFNPELDQSVEDAAERCIKKELRGVRAGSPVEIGSTKVEDWRLRRTKDTIVTYVMRAFYESGEPKPGEGISRVRWVPYQQVQRTIGKTHKPLAKLMKYRWWA